MWGNIWWGIRYWADRYWGRGGSAAAPTPAVSEPGWYSLALSHRVGQPPEARFTLPGIEAEVPPAAVTGRITISEPAPQTDQILRFLSTPAPQKHTRLTAEITVPVVKASGELEVYLSDESLLLLAVLMEN